MCIVRTRIAAEWLCCGFLFGYMTLARGPPTCKRLSSQGGSRGGFPIGHGPWVADLLIVLLWALCRRLLCALACFASTRRKHAAGRPLPLVLEGSPTGDGGQLMMAVVHAALWGADLWGCAWIGVCRVRIRI